MSNFIEGGEVEKPRGGPVFVAASLRDAIEAANEETASGYYEYGYEVLFKKP